VVTETQSCGHRDTKKVYCSIWAENFTILLIIKYLLLLVVVTETQRKFTVVYKFRKKDNNLYIFQLYKSINGYKVVVTETQSLAVCLLL